MDTEEGITRKPPRWVDGAKPVLLYQAVPRLLPWLRIAMVWVGVMSGLLHAQPNEDISRRVDWPQVRANTVETVWATVNDVYYDPAFGGVNWKQAGDRAREKLDEIRDQVQLRSLLRAMLGELGRTHFSIMPREAAVFTPEERSRTGSIGAELVWAGHELVVGEVQPESAAHRAGLRRGVKIAAIDGIAVDEIKQTMANAQVDQESAERYIVQVAEARLHGPVGGKVRIRTRSAETGEGEVEAIFEAHQGPWSEPLGSFPSVPLTSSRERTDDHVAYLRFNTFAPALMREIRAFLKSLKPGDGLIIDLRGNPGGITVMASGITGLLMDREVNLGRMKMRQGVMMFPAYPQEGAFLGPVAVLIDGRSASTSEILAAGLRDLGRARVFGERSAGAALPSNFKKLPNGDLFQYAVADLQTPKGVPLEGRGVEPDEIVVLSQDDVAAGRDAPRVAARMWLLEALRAAGARDPAVQTGGRR
jgi:carboxyl-terminal processing protease